MSAHTHHAHQETAACDSCRACACAHGAKAGHPSFGGWKKLALAAVLFAAGLLAPGGLWVKLPLYLAAYVLCGG